MGQLVQERDDSPDVLIAHALAPGGHARGFDTVLDCPECGGWIASGPPARDRVPLPVWPPGLSLLPAEMAGEVQTPVTGKAAGALKVGDRVWFRHCKAGELSEHVDAFAMVDDGTTVGTAPTYRGEGKTFL